MKKNKSDTGAGGVSDKLSLARLNAALEGLAGEIEGVRAETGEKCAVTTGMFLGDGAVSRTIVLGFRPRAVHLENLHGGRSESTAYAHGGLALDGSPLQGRENNFYLGAALMVTDNGFQVVNDGDRAGFTNVGGYRYNYVAFR